MPATETRYVAIDTNDAENWQTQDNREVCQLFSDDSEQVSLQRLKANEALFTDTVFIDTIFTDAIKGGAEILVLDGELIDTELTDDAKTYTRDSWLRLPVGEKLQIKAGIHGATVYLKTGHLSKVIGAKVEEK